MNNRKNNRTIVGIFWVFAMMSASCEAYLDKKPDSSLTLPSGIEDAVLLLNDFDRMNANFPSDGEASADNYYLEANDVEVLNEGARSTYLWNDEGATALAQWYNGYKALYTANLAIATLAQYRPKAEEKTSYDHTLGMALFFRAYHHYELAQLFAQPYRPASSTSDQGIPLRLNPNIDEEMARASVRDTYAQIISDFEQAAKLLTTSSSIPSLPNKAAAYAGLARTYLSMAFYEEAAINAGKSIALNGELLDYSMVDGTVQVPFQRFNKEVIFHSSSNLGAQLNPNRAKIPIELMSLYDENDLRRTLFFGENADGSFHFKGSYNGEFNQTIFTGLTTPEMYLTCAEGLVRTGETDEAKRYLTELLLHRLADKTQVESRLQNGPLLSIILSERRKEQVFRGTRWADLRRLNQDVNSAVALRREYNHQEYVLPPGDNRYTLLIPEEVIVNSNITQNIR